MVKEIKNETKVSTSEVGFFIRLEIYYQKQMKGNQLDE